MENAFSHTAFSAIGKIRNRFDGHALACDDGAIRIVAASAQNWPELASPSIGEIAFGDDGLIRLALWSASKCCATLLGTRRVTLLLPESDGGGEIRCLVVANASLATLRPLSGFLLKPVEFLDGHASPGAHRSSEDSRNRADETHRALLEAFPLAADGENPPSGEIHSL